MIQKSGHSYRIVKKVFLMVHLFFCYQITAQGISNTQNTHSLEAKYFEVLHYKSNDWPAVNVDTLSNNDKAFGYYINAFSACLVQFFENKLIAEAAIQKAIVYLEKATPNAQNGYYLAELYMLKSMLLASQGQNIGAFLAFRNANKQNDLNLTSFPRELNIKKTDAVIKAILGSVPNQYQWVLDVFGFSGDYKAGILELEKIASANIRLSLESELILILLQQYIDNTSGIARLEKLLLNYPKSQTVRLIFYASALKNNQSILLIDEKATPKIPLMQLQLGEAYLNALKPELAIHYYENYSRKSNKPLSAADQYKLWSAYLLLGNMEMAEKTRSEILNNKTKVTEADLYAQHEAEINKVVLPLLKIRLATDGGFYQLAEEQEKWAEKELAPNESNLAELAYRRARLAQLQQFNSKATLSFKKVLGFNISPTPYFIPNSAFQLGEIYKAQSKNDSATLYYKKCLQYKDYPYESSIRKKAALKLKEIGL